MSIHKHNLIHLKLTLLEKDEIDRNILNKSLPDTITILCLKIPPSESFGYYYSYYGIMEILSNMLKMDDNTKKHDLRNGDVYLKVFYQNSILYNLPMLCIDIFFFKELSKKTIDLINLKIKTDLLVFTKGEGYLKFTSSSESEPNQFTTPKSFSLRLDDDIFQKYSVPNKVKSEIESVLWGLVPIMKLDIRKLYDEPEYCVFEENKELIDERRTLFYQYL